MKIYKKNKLFILLGWLVIAILAFGCIYFLIAGSFILAGVLFVSAFLCLYIGGRYSSKMYLQTILITFIKNNGGKVEYEQIKSFFSDQKNPQPYNDIVPDILESMVEDNLITNQGGIITLRNENI